MTSRTASRLAWSLFALVLVNAAVASVLDLRTTGELGALPFVPVFVSFGVIGALIASRRPDSVLGWLFLFMGVGGSLGEIASEYAHYGLARTPPLRGAIWAAWVETISIEIPFVPLSLAFLLFPHGRLPSRRWRVVTWLIVATGVVGIAATALADVNFHTNFPHVPDPVQLLPASAVRPVYAAYQFAILALFLVAAAALVVRYRRSRGEERLQVKWVAFVAALAAVGFTVLAIAPLGLEPVVAFVLFVPLIPIAAGIAIFRYHLYDIDVVINKTVVFSGLAAFITVVYVGVVVGIGTLFGQGEKPNVGLSILATAVVAVAFQPVRERVQRFANRLVYGKRATPYEVLSEFSERMAGTYANEDLLPRMARILAEGTGAARADVWLAFGDELRVDASWPADAEPQPPVAADSMPEGLVPVRHQGELLGALAIEKKPGESVTPTEQKLIDDLASQAGLVLRNVGLTEQLLARLEELKASRQRIVTAQDQERRKLERNIHDGAQQQLVALAVKQRLAASLVGRDDEQVRAMLEQLQAETNAALEDIRDLARGIYPPLLADKGLAAALESQSRKAAVGVTVDADGIGRFSQEIESTVYFCVLEALNNVAKYAEATHADVRLALNNGRLEFAVHDDGRGFDAASTAYGTGLQGMADRLDAIGGSLEVRSTPGEGTTIVGRVPTVATAELKR